MPITKKVAPPYSVVFISDTGKTEVPKMESGSVIEATDSCIAVRCLAEIDGPTEFVFGSIGQVDTGKPPAYSGILKTPNGTVSLHDAYDESIAEMAVASTHTAVSIWVNDPKSEPDKVVVGLDASES